MSRERIYASYRVEVENLDGSKQEFTFDSIDTSYKDMLDRYREIKDKFSDDKDVYCITFIGVKKDGSMKAVYPPKIVNSKDEKEENNKTPFDEMKEIFEIINQYDGETYENYKLWFEKKEIEQMHVLRDCISYEDKDGLLKFAIELKKLMDERYIIKERHKEVCDFKNSLSSKKINKIFKKDRVWNIEKRIGINSSVSKNVYCDSISFSNKEEKEKIIDKLSKQGWDNILELPDNRIGYFNNFRNNVDTPKKINVESAINNNEQEVDLDIDRVSSIELDLLYSAVPTVMYNRKIPNANKKKGTTLQIRCLNDKQVKSVIEKNKKLYEKIIYIEDRGAVRLINRIA